MIIFYENAPVRSKILQDMVWDNKPLTLKFYDVDTSKLQFYKKASPLSFNDFMWL